jgi:hypothetical protein
MALPVGIPIQYDVDSTVWGKVNEGTIDAFDNNLPTSSWWLDNIVRWSATVQTAAIAAKGPLKALFPKTSSHTKFAGAVFLLAQGITTDLEDELDAHFLSLPNIIASADMLNRPPLDTILTTPSGGSRAHWKRKHRPAGDDDSSSSMSDGKAGTVSKLDLCRARFILASPCLDPEGSYKAPELTEDANAIFNITDLKMANSAMVSLLVNVNDKFGTDTYFLWRHVDQGKIDLSQGCLPCAE